jgi:putative chitinase
MLLKEGMTNSEDVRKVQIKLGLPTVRQDGNFGPYTKASVKLFQSQHGLEADGVVGDSTWNLLFAVEPKPAEPVYNSTTCNFDSIASCVPSHIVSELKSVTDHDDITDNLRLAHFLAQCAEESGNFTKVDENLNYSAAQLIKTWPHHFNWQNAKDYEHKHAKIANAVYSDRMGNGDSSSGDGYKFRGRGYIQLTGKSMYQGFSDFIGEDCVANPDLVATKYPLTSALYFFNLNRIWSICDKGNTNNVVKLVTARINPGLLGLSTRLKNFNTFYGALLRG